MIGKSGQSGVPVIEVDGQIIVGFDQARLERIIAAAGANKASLGAAVADAARILAKQGQIPVFGAYVGRVNDGSPAARAGLQAGDIIVELNMRPINNAADIERAIANFQPGGTAQIVFHRSGQARRVTVRF
jgi:serine protease Do